MDFEWDDSKSRNNLQKHGVSFREAIEVFADDFSSCILDPDHSQWWGAALTLWSIRKRKTSCRLFCGKRKCNSHHIRTPY